MEDLDILDELEVSVEPKRSTFLMVLCILTWVGSGLAILVYGYLYILVGQSLRLVRSFGGDVPEYMNWMIFQYLIAAIAPIFCIVGAVLMWKLKRLGFYVYLLGQLPPILFSFYAWLVVSGQHNSEIIFVAVLMNLIPMGFIVMYAINVKYLKK